MANETDRTMADFIAGALSPPMIMALVGSLVFFLLEVLYQGIFLGMLQWVLFFFVFGAVLIARISMNNDLGQRAGMYGFALGGAVWLALQMYVDFHEDSALAQRKGLVNLGLIVLIWWSAHRLTWDCTFVDEEEKNEGVGLLEVAGLDQIGQKKPGQEAPKKKKRVKEKSGLEGWWERFGKYWQERKKRPRTPGLWVVFFSLAALPLFGLGQAQIPPEEIERRQYAYRLLVLYMGAGLGLLLTTSFLGLRCYLRQRNVTMPLGITLVWLVLGGMLIGGLLFVGGLLPRPQDPQPMWAWTGFVGTDPLKPAPWSPFGEQGEEKGEAPQDPEAKDQAAPEKGEPKKVGKAGQTTKEAKKSQKEKGQGEKGEKEEKKNEKGEKNSRSTVPEKGANTPPIVGKIADFLVKLAQWIIVILVVLAIAFWLLRGLLQFLGNFTFWAKALLDFLESLWQKKETTGEKSDAPNKPISTPRAFASYSNPFSNGQAEFLGPVELVRYSFAALQAWGREHGLVREQAETPLEYAERIGDDYPQLGEEAVKLAILYARLAYSTDSVSAAQVKSLRTFWQLLAKFAVVHAKKESAERLLS